LTLRGFSSAVYVTCGLGLFFAGILALVLSTGTLPEIRIAPGQVEFLDMTWLAPVMATKIACILASGSLCAIVPMLVDYERRLMWVEKSTGVTGLDMWSAKLWFSRTVGAPAPLVVFAAALSTGRLPGLYAAPLLLECLWIWWVMSSIVGSLSFEIPDRPGAALAVLLGVAAAVGTISAIAWPAGIMLYAFSMNSLVERGRQRARFCLLEEGR
jgi:hypothetical protein